MGGVHGIAPTGTLEWAKKIMKTVLNTRCDAQKRPKIDAGNNCRKGHYSTTIMVQHDNRVKRSCERGTFRQEGMARRSTRVATRVEHARKTQEKASALEGLS
jgi:hypothetical protein